MQSSKWWRTTNDLIGRYTRAKRPQRDILRHQDREIGAQGTMFCVCDQGCRVSLPSGRRRQSPTLVMVKPLIFQWHNNCACINVRGADGRSTATKRLGLGTVGAAHSPGKNSTKTWGPIWMALSFIACRSSKVNPTCLSGGKPKARSQNSRNSSPALDHPRRDVPWPPGRRITRTGGRPTL